MRTVTVELQEDAAEIMDRLIRQRGYSSASECLGDVLRAAIQPESSRQNLERLLLEGLDSEVDDFTEGDWEWIDHEVERQVSARQATR